MSKLAQQTLAGLVIALVSASLTFGLTARGSISAIQTVTAVQQKQLENLHDSDSATNNRIDRLASLVEQVVKQNTELITLIRVQNQMKDK